jgi:hypothetical protein
MKTFIIEVLNGYNDNGDDKDVFLSDFDNDDGADDDVLMISL